MITYIPRLYKNNIYIYIYIEREREREREEIVKYLLWYTMLNIICYNRFRSGSIK